MNRLTSYLLLCLSFLLINQVHSVESSRSPRVIEQSLDGIISKFGKKQAPYSAEVLYKYRTVNIDADYLDTTTTYLAIRINDSQAIPFYSQFELRFDEHYETLSLDFARVKTESGEIHDVLPSTIQVKTANSALFYNNQKSLTFSVPKLLKGSVIEFQYTRKTIKPYIENHWFYDEKFVFYQRNASTDEYIQDFVNQSTVIVTYSKNIPLKIDTPQSSKLSHTRSLKNDTVTHVFSLSNIPKLSIEELMPPSWLHLSRVFFTTLDNWDQLGGWSYKMFQTALSEDNPDSILKLAESITGEISSKADKVKAIYSYIQNQTRYVYAHLGRGGFTPHTPSWTLKNGFGDCKDQTALTVALLRAIDIKAFPALYNTSGLSIAEHIPRLMFDHMITYIPAQPGIDEEFIDTSNNRHQYPGLFPVNNSTNALVIGPNSGKFVNVKANDVAIEINIETNYHTINSDSVLGTITVKAVGFYDNLIRRIWSQAQEKDKEIRRIFNPIFNTAKIDNIKVLNIDNLFNPVTLIFDIRYEAETDLSKGIMLGSSYKQLLQGFTSFLSPIDNKQRSHRIFNHADIELTFKTSISDKKVKSSSMISSPAIINTPYIQATYEPLKDETIGMTLNLRIMPFSLLPEKTDEFIRTIQTASEKGFWLANVKSSLNNSTLTSNEETQSLPSIKALINKGEYDEALLTILDLLKKSEIPEAYYLKGIILGYQNQYDESDKAFEKAIELGYEL